MKNYLALGVLLFCVSAVAQQPPQSSGTPALPSKYDKTDHVSTLLILEKEKTLNLQMTAYDRDYKETLTKAREQYVTYEQQVNAWIEKVRKDNGWDATYSYDRNSDTWTHAVPVHPKAEPKPQK